MSNTHRANAAWADPAPMSLERCHIAGRDGDRWLVRQGGRVLRAERAFGCLVTPALDDEVLVAIGDDDAFVVQVLRRASGAQPTIELDGDLDVRTGGALRFLGRAGVTLASVGTVEVVARRLERVVDVLSAVADRVSLRAKQSVREVEGLELTRAGEVEIRAAKEVSVRGENALVTAERLVKMDGEQIHVG